MSELRHFNEKLLRAFTLRGIDVAGLDVSAGTLVSDILLDAGKATPEIINQILEEITGLRSVDPNMVSFDPIFLKHAHALIPRNVALKEKVFPIKHEGNFVHVVMARPEDAECLRLLEYVTSSKITPYGCNTKAIVKAIAAHYVNAAPVAEDVSSDELIQNAIASVNQLKMTMSADSAFVIDVNVIRLVRHMLNTMVEDGASDLHFEPQEDHFRVRYRKDGVMITGWTFPLMLRDAVTSRVKLMSGLDLEIANTPQDGSIAYHVFFGRDIDVRVSSLPSIYGEKLVLRILDKGGSRMSLGDLGFDKRDWGIINDRVRRPSGLILVTGPTGSGKTTTLYAVLNDLNSNEVNIVTAEDPVEYKMEGLTQVNCGEGGPSFAEVIRSFLRQDPDIIMVGEIRDAETADFAVKAAMTGHIVLSTLHTNDAAGAINRLVNMGVPPFLAASAQITVAAQRLVRKICPQCKQEYTPDPTQLNRLPGLAEKGLKFYRGAGCEACKGGYKGRLGIYEVLPVSEDMEKMILDNEPSSALKRVAIEEGMTTLREAALVKLEQGVTTLDEVLRVTVDA